MTFDSPDVIKKFYADKSLTYPFLMDEDAKHVNAYGIRNESFTEGQPGYGVPHPGILYINKDGIVVLKLAEPGFKARPSFEELFVAVERISKGGEAH